MYGVLARTTKSVNIYFVDFIFCDWHHKLYFNTTDITFTLVGTHIIITRITSIWVQR